METRNEESARKIARKGFSGSDQKCKSPGADLFGMVEQQLAQDLGKTGAGSNGGRMVLGGKRPCGHEKDFDSYSM